MTIKDNSAAKADAERISSNPNVPDVSASELAAARKEGILAGAKEAGKDAYKAMTDGALSSGSQGPRWPMASDIMQYEPFLAEPIDQFVKTIAEKAEPAIPEDKIAGLLSLERAGQNRTLYVKALCARLGVDSPYEVTAAGPAYTNDQSPVTKL